MGQFGNRETSYSRANLTMKRGKIATRSREGSMPSEGIRILTLYQWPRPSRSDYGQVSEGGGVLSSGRVSSTIIGRKHDSKGSGSFREMGSDMHENEHAVRVSGLTASLKGPERCLPDGTGFAMSTDGHEVSKR
jgi:hypothetical protein